MKPKRAIIKANRDLIEWEIRNYKETVSQLEELKKDVIESAHHAEIPASTGPGDPTYNKVAKIRTCKAILEVERRLSAVEYALNVFKAHEDPMRIRVIEMHYFENRYTPIGIQQKLCISKDSFYRWRKEFIELVAKKLGWEV